MNDQNVITEQCVFDSHEDGSVEFKALLKTLISYIEFLKLTEPDLTEIETKYYSFCKFLELDQIEELKELSDLVFATVSEGYNV